MTLATACARGTSEVEPSTLGKLFRVKRNCFAAVLPDIPVLPVFALLPETAAVLVADAAEEEPFFSAADDDPAVGAEDIRTEEEAEREERFFSARFNPQEISTAGMRRIGMRNAGLFIGCLRSGYCLLYFFYYSMPLKNN